MIGGLPARRPAEEPAGLVRPYVLPAERLVVELGAEELAEISRLLATGVPTAAISSRFGLNVYQVIDADLMAREDAAPARDAAVLPLRRGRHRAEDSGRPHHRC